MPAGKRVTSLDGARRNKLSSLNGKRSLTGFPYKYPKILGLNQKITTHSGIQSGYFNTTCEKRSTKTIGVVVHTLHSDFIKAALIGIQKVVFAAGYEMMIMHSQGNMEREVANVQLFFDQQVDGLLASLSFGTTNISHFDKYFNAGRPVVFFDCVDTIVDNCKVVIDNIGAGYTATQHLIQQGCRHIGIVTSCLERNVYRDRYTGLRNALADHGIPFDDDMLVVKNNITEQAGVEAATQIMAMKKKPDGLFVTNDLVAAACMRSLIEHGFQVPGDIAIVGFNNDPICRLTVPAITTINYSGVEIGRVSALQLVNALANGKTSLSAETTIMPADLVVRASSLKDSSFKSI